MNPIVTFYQKKKQQYLDACTRCGLCAKACPILRQTDVAGLSPREVQKQVFSFVRDHKPGPAAYAKAFACMACFRCTTGVCPEGLNPMRINEMVKGEHIARGLAEKAFSDPAAPDSAHRVLAGLQVSHEDFRRISIAGDRRGARLVFFPGCNVYFQPEKILNAMDILDAAEEDWAFLPGLNHCCGDSLFFTGDIPAGARRAKALVAALAEFEPETVVFWCPTCHCRFHDTIAPAMETPFDVLSFPQYLAARMDRLPLTEAAAGTVTLHEACKSAYTAVDSDGARRVLQRLPGVALREMTRHGSETACCGSGAVAWFPQSFARMRDRRLKEAAATGADRLVTVCHYCSQAFLGQEERFGLPVTSYVSLVAQALGLEREDKFRKYTRWGDSKRILDDAAGSAALSIFDRGRIHEVLQTVF